mgnify:FL=1
MKPELEKQVDKLRGPFSSFTQAQTTASAFLLLALIASLLIANSGYGYELTAIRHLSLRFGIGDRSFEWSLLHLVNDGLIALFFFLIGLEIKRELVAGELQDMMRVGLLLSAAIGGMVVPAGLYLAINANSDGGMISGWGIPMATDTAIAIGVLAALGARIPKSVVAFLVGVAIIDDIGAILVIAFVYTESLSWNAVAVAGLLILCLLMLNRAGFRHPYIYVFVGVGLWAAIVQSGIHASIAGVIVAATVPARPRIKPALHSSMKSTRWFLTWTRLRSTQRSSLIRSFTRRLSEWKGWHRRRLHHYAAGRRVWNSRSFCWYCHCLHFLMPAS